MSDARFPLFTYGTLRRGCQSPMQVWLDRRARWLGPAWIRGTLFDLGAYPGLRLTPQGAAFVRGDLYRLHSPRDWRRLDRHEGIAADLPAPQEYRRRRCTVSDQDGRRLQAWVYLYNWPHGRCMRIAGGDYLAFLHDHAHPWVDGRHA